MERSPTTSLPCAHHKTVQEMFAIKVEVELAWNAMGWFSQEVFSEEGQRQFEKLSYADKFNIFRWNDYRAGRIWWEGYKILAANLTLRKLPPRWYFKTPKSEGSAAGSGASPPLILE